MYIYLMYFFHTLSMTEFQEALTSHSHGAHLVDHWARYLAVRGAEGAARRLDGPLIPALEEPLMPPEQERGVHVGGGLGACGQSGAINDPGGDVEARASPTTRELHD